MNLVIALFCLILLMALIVNRSKGMIISPAFVFTASFAFSIFICLINPEWKWDINFKTCMVIVAVNILFSLGQFVSGRVKIAIASNNKIIKSSYISKNFHVKSNMYYVACVLQIIFLVIYLRFVASIGGGFGVNMITNARRWMLYNDIPNIIGHCQLMSKCIAMGYVYIFFFQRGLNEKFLKRNIIPIAIYLIIEILSTSRSGVIFFLGYSMVVAGSLVQGGSKNLNASEEKKKIMRMCIIIIAVVALLFLMLGNLTGKTQKLGTWNSFATYFGGSIYALDYYLENMGAFNSPFWGYNCFPIIKSTMSVIGINVIVQDRYYFPIIGIPSVVHDNLLRETNLYTCINLPLCDFGLIGGLVFFFLLVLVYAFFYKIMKMKATVGSGVNPFIVYLGYFMMPIFCASAAYSFGIFLFSPTTIYTTAYIFIFMKLWLKRVDSKQTLGEQDLL